MNINLFEEDISIILYDYNKLTDNINDAVFNAKSYSEYIKKNYYLYKIEDLFRSLRYDYLSQFYSLSLIFRETNYTKFCLTKIKNKLI